MTAALSHGYSLLTHEQVVDILWKDQIEPVLLKRFPGATAEDLRQAHAHAYGGCLVQDLGYYPFGSRFFSDLTHYVRSGDFVENLIRESSDLKEYAFALGALAHYSGDSTGHPLINRAVALSFPKLRAKYGDEVTYADDPKAHIRTEFGFDMVQVAKNRYTSDRYHDFIGFEVAKPLLERAFLETYDLKLSDVLGHVDLAIGTFRQASSKLIPELTRAALHNRRAEIVRDLPTFNERKFLYNLSRSEYEKEWGKEYRRPGILARVLAFVLKILPKVGPLKALDLKDPTPQTEELYVKSVNQTVAVYQDWLRKVATGRFSLPNRNFDTGREEHVGAYGRSDSAYARLLDELSHRGPDQVNPAVRTNILEYFSGPDVPQFNRKEAKRWRKLWSELRALEALPRPAEHAQRLPVAEH